MDNGQNGENLGTGRKVILFGAGQNALPAYEETIRSGDRPVCFSDNDASKQRQKPEKLPLPCLAPAGALAAYGGDCLIRITVRDKKTRLVIQRQLAEAYGVPAERIIDYLPFYFGYGCDHLFAAICPFPNAYLEFWCQNRFFNYFSLPRTDWKTETPEAALAEYLRHRNLLIEQLREKPESSPCFGCAGCREDYWPLEKADGSKTPFVSIVYCTTKTSLCNLKCSYCYSNLHENGAPGTDRRLELLGIMERRGFAVPGVTRILLSDGEITVDSGRDALLALSDRGYQLVFYTNGVLFNRRIADILAKKNAAAVISVDAGTAETFLRIKGADRFRDVAENAAAYAKTGGNVVLKYILLDGLNDNRADIDGFLALCAKVRPGEVIFTTEFTRSRERLPDAVLDLFRYAGRRAGECALDVSFPCPQDFSEEEVSYIRGEIS